MEELISAFMDLGIEMDKSEATNLLQRYVRRTNIKKLYKTCNLSAKQKYDKLYGFVYDKLYIVAVICILFYLQNGSRR